ncbi:MAG TPA: hypothetical protein VGL86_09220 [Polyangia bacterium]|jgi:hypothetical protein
MMTNRLILALVASTTVAAVGSAREQKKGAYERMAPLQQYLIADRNAEVALARSAAPPSISSDAKVLVLGAHGYETAAEGKNGFVCLVERSWMAGFSVAEFWNPKIRAPLCFNPPAARSIVPSVLKRTELILAGMPKEKVSAALVTAFAHKELPTPLPGAVSYMMSKQQHLNDVGGHWVPHVMFHVPPADNAEWGANLPGSPFLAGPPDGPEPVKVFMLPVRTWSDGTPAPDMKM